MPYKPSAMSLHAFGAASIRPAEAEEIETKLLVEGRNPAAFFNAHRFLAVNNLIRSSMVGYHLLTRQLDLPDRALEKNGVTVRIRGQCIGGDLTKIAQTDICVKTAKILRAGGAVERGEYQARIPDFQTPVFDSLFEKYPAHKYPELRQALSGVRPDRLVEFYLIDCMRDRHVFNLHSGWTGLKQGRMFYGELLFDDVNFILSDSHALARMGFTEPFIIGRDMEIECETLHKPCEYDSGADAPRHVSSALSREEADLARRRVRHIIEIAVRVPLHANELSKAERGFAAFDRFQRYRARHPQGSLVGFSPDATRDVVQSFNRVADGGVIEPERLMATRPLITPRPRVSAPDAMPAVA